AVAFFLVRPLAFAIAVPPFVSLIKRLKRACPWSASWRLGLLLADDALRIEIADAAALAAGRRIDHGVDERRLAGIQGGIDGALELVGRRHVSPDAAERLYHLVVARAFHEHRGG